MFLQERVLENSTLAMFEASRPATQVTGFLEPAEAGAATYKM